MVTMLAPPTHQIDNGKIYGLGIEVFSGKTYNQKSVLYEALWSCPSTSTPYSPFMLDDSGNQLNMDGLFSAADGFVDWRNPKNDPNHKRYSLHKLREVEEAIKFGHNGLVTIDDYLADQDWCEISAGIWQGYRLLAVNLLSWNKKKIVMPADLKVKFLPKPLDNIALDAYRS